ncbi:MAG TPA: RNA polymerase sigma-70 factor [Bacteroidales bacterium]|nr:RNA polymerase sigma-70 factor [Bacteroidales bacterium]
MAEALHKGDRELFGQVFETYYERLCNYANTFVNNIDEAEETVQGLFLILWEKREVIEIHTSVKSYLYQAVHNQALNRIKHEKVRHLHAEFVQHNADTSSDPGDEKVIGGELEMKINEAINSLPAQCRRVFQLSRFENLTYAEISEQLNISKKTIENHMGKALRIMREKLKEYLPLLILYLLINNYCLIN